MPRSFLAGRRWLAAVALALGGAGSASAQVAAPEPAAAPPAAVPAYSLPECLSIALERRPSVRAARASLAQTLAGQRALGNIHPWTSLLAPDLPVRRMQSNIGVQVAQADVCKAEHETTYDVIYTYFSYVHTKEQEITANDVIVQSTVFYDIAKTLLDQGADLGNGKKITQFTVYAIEDAITLVKREAVRAKIGQPRALAALKEAMGVDQNTAFTLKDTELPIMGGTITQEQVVELAVARRPELTMAAAGVDVFRLEACAQDKIANRRTVPTLAAGSDLHSRAIPAAVRNGEYRPGALHPEMPTTLVGRREDRVARAIELGVRQDEVYASTVALVRLEAINAFLDWKETVERMELAKERYERGKKNVDLSRKNATNLREYDFLVKNEALFGQAVSEYKQAVFDNIKAVARLDRVTAGGIKPAFLLK